MADSKIVITAGLSSDSTNKIRDELDAIAKTLNEEKAFKIQCHIDDSDIKTLQDELDNLAKKIKLNVNVTPQSVSKVQTDSSTTTTTVKVNSKDAETQIAELNKIIQNNLGNSTKGVLNNLLNDIQQSLGQNSTIWTDWTKTTEGALTRFSVSVKNADGVVNKFNYTVDKTGKLQPLNIVGSDKGVLQNQKQLLSFIDEYTKKINALRSTNNANFTTEFKGQTVSFDSLLKDLEKLANGEGSIEDVRAKFVALDGTIKSVINYVKESGGKSLNPINNANISAKEFDNTLKKIGIDLNNLKGFKYTGNDESIATVKELNSNYKDLKKTIKELNSVEEGQRGNEWYIKYAQVATQVRNLQNEIRLLNKLKKEDSSSGSQKQIEEINKIIGAYKKLIQIQKDKASSKTGDYERQWLNQQEGGYRTLINSAIKRLEKEGLLTKEIKEQIKSEEKVLSIIQNRIRVRQRDIEATKAQNEAAKASAQAQKEQERERSNIVTEIKDSYRELARLYAKKTSPTSGVDVQAEAARQEAALKLKIEELSTEEKLTEQDREQIRLAQEKYNNQIRLQDGANKNVIARQQEKQQTKEENQLLKQQIQERNKIVSEIENAYKRMIELNETMSSPKTKTNAYLEAQAQFEIEQRTVREKERELQIYTQSLGYSNTLLEEDAKRLQIARDRYEAETSMQSARLKDADETKKQTEEYRKLVAEIKQYKTILSNFNNSNLMKQNKGNGDVSQQMKDNTELLGKLQQISAMLSNGKNTSLGVLTQARQQLNDLIKPLETATQRSEQLNNSLTNQKINQQVSKNYNSLINQINTYARNNIKAIESTDKMNDGLTRFKDEWRVIQETANDVSLKGNAAAITDLANRFNNFTGQARAAGLASTRFFVDMGSQLRMVLNRYISLYAVIGYIRRMVDNVKELDNAMINLRRVTDETNTGYVKFLKDANKQAQELKVTTSELVQQTYQWAKLGFDMNEALGLSKASTIFSKVADITEDQALKNLITTLKAYGIEAKNVMRIVDELDNLNNRYAVDAGGLGDGLERSASALAMTGNSLEQSLAMLTGAGEITQNLENTGRILPVRNYIG